MGNQIDWKDPAVELPKASGDYMAIILSFKGKANVGTYSFSARHNAFNCYDHDAIPKHKIDVLAWAELPDTPGWVKGGIDDDSDTKKDYKKAIKDMVDTAEDRHHLISIYSFVRTLSEVALVQQEEKNVSKNQ